MAAGLSRRCASPARFDKARPRSLRSARVKSLGRAVSWIPNIVLTALMLVRLGHYVLLVGFGALVAIFGWQVSELNSQSFSPALDLNLRWLYLSSVAGGALIVVYSLAAFVDVWHGREGSAPMGVD
jgi:TRAP-type C4-dicarboxylate transport system permease small subunit